MNTQQKPQTISVYEFLQKFPDEASAVAFFENKRWPAVKNAALVAEV